MKPFGRRNSRRDDLSCMQVMRVLQSYLDGATDDITTGRVARHLAHCRRCGLEAATFQAIKDALAHRDVTLPADALERLRSFAASLADGDQSTGEQGLQR